MDFVPYQTNYHVRVENPNIDLDHLYPELDHVLLEVKISLQVEQRFINYLVDGSTTENYFLNPVKERSCIFVHREFFSNIVGTYTTLLGMLSTLEIDEQCYNQILDNILSNGRDMYNCKENRGRNVLFLNVNITKKQDYVPRERYLTNIALGESEAEFENTNYGMVPANQSALRSLLKRVKIEGNQNHPTKRTRTSENSQNCTICLEEFEEAHAISMPCSHWFHGGCIFRWLKQSHYCPVCRYEMPT